MARARTPSVEAFVRGLDHKEAPAGKPPSVTGRALRRAGGNTSELVMMPYYQHFGLDRDPFLDTADPHFYRSTGNLAHAKNRLVISP